jgi:ABC-2 type transport system permease protein
MKMATQKRSPPSDMKQVMLVTRYDIYKHLRSKRLLGFLIVEAALLFLILALPPLLGNDYNHNPDGYLSSFTNSNTINLLIVVGATLFAGDAIVSEYQNRTGYLIFPNPVKKSVLFAGKFLASTLIIGGAVLLWYGVAMISGVAITGSVTVLAAYSLLLALLYSIACIGVGFFLSALMKGSTGALVFTFALLFLILPIVDSTVGAVGGVKPEISLTFAGGTIDHIMQTPYPVDANQTIPVAAGQNITLYSLIPNVGTSVVVMAGYVVVLGALTFVLFKRKEMVG